MGTEQAESPACSGGARQQKAELPVLKPHIEAELRKEAGLTDEQMLTARRLVAALDAAEIGSVAVIHRLCWRLVIREYGNKPQRDWCARGVTHWADSLVRDEFRPNSEWVDPRDVFILSPAMLEAGRFPLEPSASPCLRDNKSGRIPCLSCNRNGAFVYGPDESCGCGGEGWFDVEVTP